MRMENQNEGRPAAQDRARLPGGGKTERGMNRFLTAVHIALATTIFLPTYVSYFPIHLDRPTTPLLRSLWSYDPDHYYNLCTPEEEARLAIRGQYHLRSVVAAGVPGFLALLNLPLLIYFTGSIADRWKSLSSLVLGLLSTSLTSQLLARYGFGAAWGGWVIWNLSLVLMIAGTAALARAGKSRDSEPVIRDS